MLMSEVLRYCRLAIVVHAVFECDCIPASSLQCPLNPTLL